MHRPLALAFEDMVGAVADPTLIFAALSIWNGRIDEALTEHDNLCAAILPAAIADSNNLTPSLQTDHENTLPGRYAPATMRMAPLPACRYGVVATAIWTASRRAPTDAIP